MENQDLHDRLDALGKKIHATDERLREKAHFYHDSTHLTAEELKQSYRNLQARLNGEIDESEAHGHHVSDLERSVRQWLHSIDSSHTARN